jgi:hypothetical protein
MRVFLSYQTRDIAPAERLAEALRRERPELDIFLAPRVLTAGAYWLPRLADELATADAMLLLVGQRIGPWQELEYYEAQRLSRLAGRDGRPAIVPVIMVEQAPGLPFFDLLHRIFAPDPAHPDTVGAVLAAVAGAAAPGREPAWKQFNPYKGLPALTSTEAAFFFGREELTARILDALRPNPDSVLVLVGASGVGKSSVAQAGVLAALKSQLWPGDPGREWPAELADSRAWLEVTIRPGDAPLEELALGFVRLIVDKTYEQDGEADGWVARFRNGARLADLVRVVRRELSARTGADTLRDFVLYVDQGEELYSRASPADAGVFSALLADAARHPDFHVLASLRADYYGQLQADAALFASSERIDIPPLRADKLEMVIRHPAERLGATFDSPEMPARIAAATASEPGALPLLSYLMSDMWTAMQARGDGVLRWSDRPELIDVAAPLRERAERYRLRHPAQETALRRLFTLRLAHVPRQGQAVRRQARRRECSQDEWAIAETLAGSEWRLLTLNAPDDGVEPVAEVAHEQLLRKWPTLTRWLDEQHEFLIWKGEVEADRREWEKLPASEKATGQLSGRRLLRAQQWLGSHADDVPRDDRAFIEASIAADAEARNKVLLDQQRLQEARYEAALTREAAAKKVARRTVIGAIAVGATGGAAGLFGYRAYEAERRAVEAEQQREVALGEFEAQQADLRSFWAQQRDGRDPRIDLGGPEQVRVLPGGQEASDAAAMPTWGVAAVAADESRYTGRGCVVALLGTGIDASHPAFRGLTLIEKDFTGTGHGDRNGHNTHTAGTIFGRPVGGQRFGIAPGVTEVLIGKVLDDSGAGGNEAILAGLRWVADHPRRVDVICVPLGVDYALVMSRRISEGPTKDVDVANGLREYLLELRTYQSFSVVAASIGKGAVLIMPAGNNSHRDARVPVTSPISVAQGVISVGAVERGPTGYRVPWYSNSFPTVCAPGQDIPSAYLRGGITALTGTSMACAHAAGVAALWWEALRSRNGNVNSRMVADAMLKAVRSDVFAPDVQDDDRGAGLIRAPQA